MMKNDMEMMKSVRAAIDDCTRGIDQAASLRYRIARRVKGEEPVKKKASASMLLVIALMIATMTAALAAGLGLFGELAARPHADERLSALEQTSETVGASLTAEDGVTVEIGQAYYEGNRVFVSYRIAGRLAEAALYEGAPEDGYQWDDVREPFIVAEEWTSDFPDIQKANLWLNGEGQRWAVTSVAFLQDGLYLEDGTYLDIIGGDEAVQEDGSLVGWKECEIPKDKIADTLTFKAVLSRSNQVLFQDGSAFRRKCEREDGVELFFSLCLNDRYVYLKGAAESELYQAKAELASGRIDMKGTIQLTAPEAWVMGWTDPEAEEAPDRIAAWSLYQDGVPVSWAGTQSIQLEGTTHMCFEQLYPLMTELDGLTLVPEYSKTGEHPDEAISLRRIIE